MGFRCHGDVLTRRVISLLNLRVRRSAYGLVVLLFMLCAAVPAQAQNRLGIATSVLDAPGGTVAAGADFRYRVSYSCDLVSIPSCDGAVVTVDLPPEVEYRSSFFPPLDVASSMHDGSPTGGVVTFTFQASVPAGNAGDLDITVRFPNGSTADGTTTTNLADAAESSGTSLVTQMADLPAVTATASPQVDLDVAVTGFIDDCPDPAALEVTIGPSTNDGSLNFIDVTQLVLTLPTGVTGVSPNDGGIFDAMAGTVTWTNLGIINVPNSTTVSVDVTFAEPPFTDGQMVTAIAEATVDALGEPPGTVVGPIPVDLTLTAFTESPDASVGKSFADGRPGGLPPAEGQAFAYSIDIRNSGNIDLDTLTVTDDGDGAGADLDAALSIAQVSTGAYNPAPTSVTVNVTGDMGSTPSVTSVDGATDTALDLTGLLMPGERVITIEWVFNGGAPVGMVPTTRAQVDAVANAGFASGTVVDNHLTADWTATITGICGDTPGPASGSAGDSFPYTVADAYTYLRPRKNELTTGPYFPGDTVRFGLEITNDDLANDPAVNPVVTDLLPEFLTFQAASETYADNGTGVVLAAPGDFEVIPNYNNTGRTLLRWTLTGDLDPGETVDITFETTVELGVIFGSLNNQLGMTFPAGPTDQICAGASTVDAADLDGDSDTSDTLCVENEVVTIAAVAQLSSGKFVRGQCDLSYLPGLNTGTVVPSGLVDWRVTVQNVQTVPIENFVIVDILPFIGDTGVRDLTARLSLFRPILVEPIAPPPGGAVFYSLSGNPCRPEVGGPTSGCDNPNWTPIPPDPISDVQSIKIEFGDRVLNPLDVLEFEWPMVLPADAPTDGSEAFNSFAFGSNRQDDGGFLGAEPNKVGIDAACVPSPDAMLGDYVWIDTDGDGIQDGGEVGVNDVRVQLFEPGPDGLPRTGDDVLLLTTLTADDAMGNPGFYKFQALAAGDYYVQFFPPLGFEVTLQDQGGDEALDSDTDPASACTEVVTLAVSENNPDVDMGLVPQVTASLGDRVWFDLNGDGIQNEALDRGLNGVTVRLFADDGDNSPEPFGDDGTPLQVTVTADDDFGNPGYYLFEELLPGVAYFVQFAEPLPSTGFTTRNAGGDDTVDSDARLSNGTTPVVTLAAGEHNPTLDAGIVLLTGTLSLGNVVWIDDDGNDIVDAVGDDDGSYDPLVPEAGVDGVRVNLYLDLSGDGAPQVNEFVATTTTQTLAGKTGRYRFDNLPAGDFIVEVDASNFAADGALQGRISSTFTTVDPNDDIDSDDSGRFLGTSVVSEVITLSEDAEPTPDADDDIEDDDNINFTLDFGFIAGPSPFFDFGDNPDAGAGTSQGDYRTVSLDGGPSHLLLGAAGPFLGACVDADNGQNQNVAATADDLTGAVGPIFGTCAVAGDDEDGVTFSSTLLSRGGTFDITTTSVSATACVINGFIDWNRDGDFDEPDEHILMDTAPGLSAGLAVPATAVPGFTYARFRCSSAGGDGPEGPASDGEVEDYRLQVIGADWGDAPDSYGTTLAMGGPVHATNPTVFMYLGNCVDTEGDGQPGFATGDDLGLGDSRIGDCVDDEDGVVFGGMLVRGMTTPYTVTASMPGRVDAWLDFDGNGTFDPADQILSNVAVAAGANAFMVSVPANAAPGFTYARFRYSSAGNLPTGGMAADGEVEDYRVILKAFDFGDAPEPTYPTTLGSGGAQHVVDPTGSVYLGSPVNGCADVEDDGAPGVAANGDDTTPSLNVDADAGICDTADDEDGIAFDTMLITCQQAQITVTVGGDGRLDAWLDYDPSNANGFGGTSDQIFNNVALTTGANVLNFTVPCTAELGTTYARFRYSSTGGLAPTGLAMDGEVEDYAVFVKGVDFGDAADTYGTSFSAGGPTHGVDTTVPTTLALGACVDTEVDAGLPLNTTGDDVNSGTSLAGTCAVAGDDEDGVSFDTPIIACQDADLTVTATTGGVLDAWLDFGADGTFDAGDQIFNGQALAAGANALTFNVPCTASPGTTSVRFRFSSTGVAGPAGPAMDGEVEDYQVEQWGVDFGDDPDSYSTSFGSSGAFHTVDPGLGLYLGSCVDTEADGPFGATATGDDLAIGSSVVGTCTGDDDEDGVTFDTLITACKAGEVTVTASAAGLLDAWIDFEGDGSFAEAGDQVFTSEPLVAGANPLAFIVPCTATDGTTYARFRFSAAGGLSFDGPADTGEVEDYVLSADEIDFGDAPDTYLTSFASGGPAHGLNSTADLYLGACVDSETDGPFSVGADGDDLAAGATELGTCIGNDDEDGVTFDTPLIACQQADLTLVASNAGFLDAWLDFDGDGTFGGPDDRIFTAQALAAGANALSITVPCDAVAGDTYARFRFSSSGNLPIGGTTPDGEIEDYLVSLSGADLGDAPDTYQTTESMGGANHGVGITPNLFLGTCVDIDADGQPSVGADGDDLGMGSGTVGTCVDGDDEDGVTFDTMVNVCLDATITVTAGAPGLLDAWLDLNGDGTFGGPDDRIFASEPLVAGPNVLVFSVPCDATPGDSYARFRFSSAGVSTAVGPSVDGEVEDYAVLVAGFDFGDSPDPIYPTLLANDGARHIVQVSGNPVLGTLVDIETEAQQSTNHLGDDLDGMDDEDGVSFLDADGILVPGTTTTIEVTAGAVGGLLDAFIDWNRDGDWDDAGEQIAVSLPVAAGTTVPLSVDVPVGAVEGTSCARFRLSTAGGLSSTGQAMDGEVEDYGVEIGVEDPVLGLGKQLVLLEQQDVNRWLVRLEMMVENLGNVPLSGIQIQADFADAFAEADGFSIDLVTSGEFTVNPDFDGDTIPLVLTGTDTLEVGGTGTVLIDLTLRPGTEEGPYICSSLVTGTSPGDDDVDDPSQDGGDPDPDDDGDPNDDNDPTVIEVNIPVPEIPTMREVGLVFLTLLLAGVGIRRLRGGAL